jgi:hypothetical protein
MMTRQSLAWAHGVVTVEALGGMIGPTSFVLPDGRQVSPFHIAPWFDEPLPPGLPGILHRLRGEWPCVPFGADAPRPLPPEWPSDGATCAGADVPHGPSSNMDWRSEGADPTAITMSCTYPDTHPIKTLHRSVRPDPNAAALDFTLTIEARRPCRLPFGLHPTLRLLSPLAHLVLHNTAAAAAALLAERLFTAFVSAAKACSLAKVSSAISGPLAITPLQSRLLPLDSCPALGV